MLSDPRLYTIALMMVPFTLGQCLFLISYDSIHVLYCGINHSGSHAVLLAHLFLLNLRQELVPCVLLSFDNEQILMWRGQGWKSMYQDAPLALTPTEAGIAGDFNSLSMH